METDVFIPCGNLRLHGRLYSPEKPVAACVICHPHPLYGGDMDSNIVIGVTEALAQADVMTLRFNFRGVGGSGGTHDGGRGELDDARAAAAYLRTQTDAPLSSAGYSFGSIIALRLLDQETAVTRGIAVAPPLGMFNVDFLETCAKPVLLIAGSRDPYCGCDALDSLMQRMPATTRLVSISGGDHFLNGREDAIGEAAARFVTGGGAADLS